MRERRNNLPLSYRAARGLVSMHTTAQRQPMFLPSPDAHVHMHTGKFQGVCVNVAGWMRQQAIKIAAADLVETPFMVSLLSSAIYPCTRQHAVLVHTWTRLPVDPYRRPDISSMQSLLLMCSTTWRWQLCAILLRVIAEIQDIWNWISVRLDPPCRQHAMANTH